MSAKETVTDPIPYSLDYEPLHTDAIQAVVLHDLTWHNQTASNRKEESCLP